MIKTILKRVREYKKPSLLSPLFVGLETLIECIMPYVIALLINFLQNKVKNNIPFVKEDMNTVLLYSSILIVLAFLSLTFGFLAGKNCAIASCGLAKNLRRDLYYHIQEFSFENIDKFS